MNAEQVADALMNGNIVREQILYPHKRRVSLRMADGAIIPVQASALGAALRRVSLPIVIHEHLLAHWSDYACEGFQDTSDMRWIVIHRIGASDQVSPQRQS